MASVVNQRTGEPVFDDVRTAEGSWGAFKGLMFDASMPDRQGLLFRPARGIHTHFMRFPIDLIFLDDDDRVVAVRESMTPWKFDFRSAAAVIEANGGTARTQGIKIGDVLLFNNEG
ncbi:MAG: DUF192 domain-containing protein [Chloroflexota bacterium]